MSFSLPRSRGRTVLNTAASQVLGSANVSARAGLLMADMGEDKPVPTFGKSAPGRGTVACPQRYMVSEVFKALCVGTAGLPGVWSGGGVVLTHRAALEDPRGPGAHV